MTLGSLFDGSGGFPLAGVLVGITPVWSSEIEAYPLRVTAARFPDWWTDGVEGSDSAQYKMWGNGIALPCAVDVLSRIAREGKK